MKNPLPIIAIALFILIGMTGTASVVHAEDEGTPKAEAPKDAKDAGKGDEGGSKKKQTDVSGGHFSGDPVYVHLPPLVLPILATTGPEQLVTVQITVQVKDMDAADNMNDNMPRVMDALLQVLYGGLGSGSLREGRIVDVMKLKGKAMSALQNLEGSDNIKEVLIVNMSQRLL